MIFGSERIISIIEKNGWNLYDITDVPTDKEFTWDEIAKLEITKFLTEGHSYIFTPIKENGKSLRETYRKTMGLGPTMYITTKEMSWIAMRIQAKLNNKKIALFTRLIVENSMMLLTSPVTVVNIYPDILICNIEDATRMFESYFHIVYPEDFGVTTPVPMPAIFN